MDIITIFPTNAGLGAGNSYVSYARLGGGDYETINLNLGVEMVIYFSILAIITLGFAIYNLFAEGGITNTVVFFTVIAGFSIIMAELRQMQKRGLYFIDNSTPEEDKAKADRLLKIMEEHKL